MKNFKSSYSTHDSPKYRKISEVKKYLVLFLFAIVAIFNHGYQFAYSDQEIIIPYVLKSADQSLFPQDKIFSQSSAHLSLFYPMAGFLTKFIDIQTMFFVGYLIFQFAFFCAIYRLSKVLLNDKNLAFFSLLPFMLPKFIGGTATQTFDIFFGYRSIGIVFLIFYLSFLIEKKYKTSAILAGLALIFHPLSAAPAVFSILPVLVFNLKMKIIHILKIFAFPLFLLIVLILISQSNLVSYVLSKDDTWLGIIKFRDSYLFASTWKLSAWGASLMYFFLCAVFLNRLKKDNRKTLIIIVLAAVLVFIINVALLEVLRLPQFAQFQLLRSIAPVAYFGLCLSPLFLTYKSKVLKIFGVLAFTFLCFNLFYPFAISALLFALASYTKQNRGVENSTKFTYAFAAALVIVYLFLRLNSYQVLTNRVSYPKKEDDWETLQRWVNQNTDKSAKFFVPPYTTGFRIYSRRGIVGDIKDGAVVMYSPVFAKRWYGLIQDLNKYDDKTEADFKSLQNEYDFNFIISNSQHKLNFEQVYFNKTYKIYKI